MHKNWASGESVYLSTLLSLIYWDFSETILIKQFKDSLGVHGVLKSQVQNSVEMNAISGFGYTKIEQSLNAVT